MRTLFFIITFLLFTSTATTAQDTTPPELVDFNFTPTTIDVSSTSQDVTYTIRITDDLSGVAWGSVWFVSPGGGISVGQISNQSDLISGDALDGVYQKTITFPVLSEAGTWQINVFMVDSISNSRNLSTVDLIAMGFPTDLEVISVTEPDIIISPTSHDFGNQNRLHLRP